MGKVIDSINFCCGFRLVVGHLLLVRYLQPVASLILKVEIGLNAVVKEELMLGLNKGSSKTCCC
jgi:hypothetical protein